MSAFKAVWMAFRLIFHQPQPKSKLDILDVCLCALYFLNWFTSHQLFFVETSQDLKNTDACFEHSRLTPSLLDTKWITGGVIVERDGFAEIFKKPCPSFSKPPKVLYPSIYIGLCNEPGIKIQRIVPDLLENTTIF
nr:unnamed protein product [Callosobruchus chinensis]